MRLKRFSQRDLVGAAGGCMNSSPASPKPNVDGASGTEAIPGFRAGTRGRCESLAPSLDSRVIRVACLPAALGGLRRRPETNGS